MMTKILGQFLVCADKVVLAHSHAHSRMCPSCPPSWPPWQSWVLMTDHVPYRPESLLTPDQEDDSATLRVSFPFCCPRLASI